MQFGNVVPAVVETRRSQSVPTERSPTPSQRRDVVWNVYVLSAYGVICPTPLASAVGVTHVP